MNKNKKWYKTSIGIIISLILFFPAGLYLMWKYSNWSKYIKYGITIFYFIFMMFYTIQKEPSNETYHSDGNDISNIESKNIEEEKAYNEEEKKVYTEEDKKNDFLNFYSEILSIDTQTQDLYNKVLKNMEGVDNGNVNNPELYIIIKDTKNAILQNRKQFIDVNTPESLNEYKNDLNEIKNNFSTSYFTLSEGLDYMADYLNTNDLSKYEKANNSIKQYQSFYLTSSLKIIEVSEKIGVSLEELNIYDY